MVLNHFGLCAAKTCARIDELTEQRKLLRVQVQAELRSRFFYVNAKSSSPSR